METAQFVYLPKACFPAKVIAWKVNVNDIVAKDQSLGIYEFTETVVEEPEHIPGATVSAVPKTSQKRTRREIRTVYEGRVDSLGAKPGDTIEDPKHALIVIVEPCGHPVQLNGLCAVCGKDLSIADYTGTDMERATIRMTHDASGITVSHKEAFRLEKETADRLLDERKLSLVLDLDQTVIHATVDPTVGEWMADPNNPNFPALTEVHSFVLPESPAVYFIKLRPGTREFLRELNAKYEMHIYTMGTRNYAKAVSKILDPDKRYFKDRILSRDDSGSFSVKSLQRLFPCDQSMVVVVDDRADVWHWSPNLLRIKAYDFFVGIGDINEPVYAAAAELTDLTKAKVSHKPHIGSSAPPESTFSVVQVDIPELEDSKLDPDTDSDSETSENKAELLAKMQDVQMLALKDQQNNRPLLHCQEELDIQTALLTSPTDNNASDLIPTVIDEGSFTSTTAAPRQSQAMEQPQVSTAISASVASTSTLRTPTSDLISNNTSIVSKQRPVLIDTDRELNLIKSLMMYIHQTFYERSDAGDIKTSDVRVIVPEMKRSILEGVHILFTSIIPLGLEPQKHEHWIAATSYGAVCHVDLDPEVTHVIAGKTGTAKVNAARKRPNVAILKIDWLIDTIRTWQRADEVRYLLYLDHIPVNLPPRCINSFFLDSAPAASTLMEDRSSISDQDELLIVQGKWEHANEIYEKVGGDDWKEMDAEVDMAMMDDDSSDITGDDDSADAVEKFGAQSASINSTSSNSGGKTSKDSVDALQDDDWDSLADEIELGLEEVLTNTQPKSKSSSRVSTSSEYVSNQSAASVDIAMFPARPRKPSPLGQYQTASNSLEQISLADGQETGDDAYFDQMDAWEDDDENMERIPKRKFDEYQDEDDKFDDDL
ncbi:CTD phosphatase Fcp1 [Batrachochytrium dendrobatidis]